MELIEKIKEFITGDDSDAKKTGVALGGGAVLGAAHVGVLKAIEEEGYEITHITGTSIGAFIAAFYAFGIKLEDIEKLAEGLNWFDMTNISLSKFSLLSNQKMGELIVKHIGDKNIEDANIPLAFIATDATNGKKVILKEGSVAQAVMASMCIPGVFKPIKMGDVMLIDGGIVENVPIDTLRSLGAEHVIGVDLNAKYHYRAPQNILDIIINSFHLIMKQKARLQTELADILIEPDLSEFSMSDLDQLEQLMEKGYSEAKKCFKLKK